MGSKRITVEELSELLELGTWELGYKGYVITEEFDGKVKRVFDVEDLHIEVDKDWVMFYDNENKLINSVLMAQLKASILSIDHYYLGKCLHDVVNFRTGHVNIDAISA